MIEEYLHAKEIGSRHAGKVASKRTIKAYRVALNASERLVGVPLCLWTTHEGDKLVEAFSDLGPAYRANILSAVRGYFNWMIATEKYQGVHPLLSIMTPPVSRNIPVVLTKEQLSRFFAAFDNRKYQIFFKLMYFGGLRIGEVTQLRCEDIRHNGIIVRGKGDKQRFVYLPETILHELLALLPSGSVGYVFRGESANACKEQPITLAHARELFDKAKKTCGLPLSFHPHNLRATSATHFHEVVGDLAMTQKFLGHARPETTMIYTQIADTKMQEASRLAFS